MPKTKALKHLEDLIKANYKVTHPSVPSYAIPLNTFTSAKPEKREKKRIEKFLQLMPGCTGNINENTGTRVDKTRIIDNGINVKQVGSVEWHYSGVRKGIEDVSGIIKGRMFAIELKRVYKNGKDRQSPHQKIRQKEVEAAGGIYIIVESYEDFYNKFWSYYN